MAKPGEGKDGQVLLLFWDIGKLPAWAQLIVCSGAVFCCYLIYGYISELIFRTPGFAGYGWFLTLFQFGLSSLFSIAHRLYDRDLVRKIPLKLYAQLALYQVVTIGFSNASLGYINYPSHVIFKSCKLIPVLIGGILIQKKKYGALDFLACGIMSFGLIMFTLANSQLQPNFDPKGYVMICTALVADAIIGNVQEKTIKAYHASNDEVILYTYTIGFVYILFVTIFTGELVPAFQFSLQHPLETFGYGLPFTVMGYVGINIVLTLIRRFGALVAVTVTTCRKAVSICISFLVFAKPFTFQYVWSGCLILVGIYLNVYSKNPDAFHNLGVRVLSSLLLAAQRAAQICRKRPQKLEGPEYLV